MAGGPSTSACDIGRVMNNSEARAYADEQRAALAGEGSKWWRMDIWRGPCPTRRAAGRPAACCAPCSTCLRRGTTRARTTTPTARSGPYGSTTSGRAAYCACYTTGKRSRTRPSCAAHRYVRDKLVGGRTRTVGQERRGPIRDWDPATHIRPGQARRQSAFGRVRQPPVCPDGKERSLRTGGVNAHRNEYRT